MITPALEFLRYTCDMLVWERERVHQALSQLTNNELWLPPAPGCNSAGNLILHLCGNIRQWTCAVSGMPCERHREREFTDRPDITLAALLPQFDAVIDEALSVFSALDEMRLTEPCTVQGFDETVLTVLYEIERHLANHVGQIVLLVKLRRGDMFVTLWTPATT